MLRSQEIQLDMHDARATYTEKLNGTDNKAIATAGLAVAGLEKELAVALREEATGLVHDGETAEVRGLLRKVRVSNYIGGLLDNKQLDGPERELNAAVITGRPTEGGLMVPFAVLAGPMRPQAVDTDFSPLSAPAQSDAVLSRLFAGSDVDFLGARYISKTEGGDSLVTVIGGAGTGSFAAEGAEVAAVAATVSVETMKPLRTQESYQLRREDLARLPQIELALADDLRMAVRSGVDKGVIRGTGAANNQPSGLVTALAAPNNAPAAVAAWADYVKIASGAVDGIGASMLEQVRVLLGTDTYEAAASVVNGAGSDRSALEYLTLATDGVRASAHMPGQSNANVQATFAIRTGAFPSCILVAWNGGSELIVDPFSGRLSGEVGLTVLSLVDFQVVRNAGFVRSAVKLA